MPLEQRPHPVFVTGCHRSGTTLLRYFLDAHPALACPPESKFILGLHSFAQDPQSIVGLYSLGVSDRHLRKLLRNMIENVLMSYAIRQGKARWIDKTPNYVRILPFIDDVFEHEAQFILIVRHPFDCVLSLQEFFRYASEFHEDSEIRSVVREHGNQMYGWARHWRDIHEQIWLFACTNSQRVAIVKYEDLVRHTEAELSKLLDFIAVERYTGDTGEMCSRAFTSQHTNGYQDVKIRSTQQVHPQSIGKWQHWTEEQKLAHWTVVGSVAETFGYRHEYA
jgi:hypothetical protein